MPKGKRSTSGAGSMQQVASEAPSLAELASSKHYRRLGGSKPETPTLVAPAPQRTPEQSAQEFNDLSARLVKTATRYISQIAGLSDNKMYVYSPEQVYSLIQKLAVAVDKVQDTFLAALSSPDHKNPPGQLQH